MTRSYNSCSKILGVALLAGLWTIACSSDDNNPVAGTGGSTSASTAKTGGSTAKTGGAPSTSSTAKTGGAPSTATGGAQSTGTGGAPSTGTGTKPTGGVTSTSTVAVGGTTGVGGVTSTQTGGTKAAGGTVATGGSSTCSDADGGPDGGPPVCCGCLKLYVPLEAQNTGTDFEVDYGTSTTIDLTHTTVTAHVYVDTAGTAGGIRLYGKNDDVTKYATVYSTWQNLSALDGGWHDISLDFSQIAASPYPNPDNVFDKVQVRWIGFNIAAGAAFDGGVFDPVTVYVDWIKFTPVANPPVTDDFAFTTTVEGFSTNANNSPLAGSTYTWQGQ